MSRRPAGPLVLDAGPLALAVVLPAVVLLAVVLLAVVLLAIGLLTAGLDPATAAGGGPTSPTGSSGPAVPAAGVGSELIEVVGSEAETGWWMIRVSDGEGAVTVLAPGVDQGPPGVVTIPADLLFFEIDSSVVEADDGAVLDQVASSIVGGGQPVTVVGHTDDTGPGAYNQELGAARAEAVRRLLIERGVPPELVANGASRGETCPVDTNDTPGGRAANRRVEIVPAGLRSPCPPAATPNQASSNRGG